MSQKNKENLRSFHHSAIRRILGIIWTRVREERITNKEVTYCFLQIPDIDAFIVWHRVRYVRKVCRSKGRIIPKKLLGAWIQHPWKTGKPQYSCNIYQMIPSDVLTYSGIFVQDTNDVTPCSSGHIGFATLGVFLLYVVFASCWMIWHRFWSSLQMIEGLQWFNMCGCWSEGKL